MPDIQDSLVLKMLNDLDTPIVLMPVKKKKLTGSDNPIADALMESETLPTRLTKPPSGTASAPRIPSPKPG